MRGAILSQGRMIWTLTQPQVKLTPPQPALGLTPLLSMELADIEAFRVEPTLGKSHHSSPLHDGPLEQQSVTQGPSLQAGMKCTRDQQSTPTSPTSPELSTVKSRYM